MPVDPAALSAPDPALRQAQSIANLERRVRILEGQLQGRSVDGFPVVPALPAFGREGRALVLSTDHKLYVDSGTAWVAQT